LNLSGNKIIDLSFGSVLASCPALRSVFLSRNPVERISKYRAIVSYFIPGLEMLDGAPIDPNLVKKITASVLEEQTAALKLIQEELDEEDRMESDIYGSIASTPSNPARSVQHSNSLAVPNNSLAVSMSHHPNATGSELIPDTGSELTHGSAVVLAGNMAAAMRKRRHHNENPLGHGSSSGGHSTREEGKEFESALDVLDSALLPQSYLTSTLASNNQSNKNHGSQTLSKHPSLFMKEGDITDVVLGPSTPNLRPTSSYQKAAANKDMNSDSLELNPEYLNSPTFKPPKTGTKASGNNTGPNSFTDPDNSQLLSASRRPQSAFNGINLKYAPTPDKPVGSTNTNISNATGKYYTERLLHDFFCL
jgi:hypothetical protein